jgi:3-mercaptopyruvate sulfurtransferase SseA
MRSTRTGRALGCLLVLALAAVPLGGCSEKNGGEPTTETVQTEKKGVSRITPEEVKARMDGGETFVFVDSRSAQSWKGSTKKLPGAIRVPSSEVAEHLDEIPREGVVVVYCT